MPLPNGDPTPQEQAAARQTAIGRGFGGDEVDKFIKEQGGARTSAERITSGFQQTLGSGLEHQNAGGYGPPEGGGASAAMAGLGGAGPTSGGGSGAIGTALGGAPGGATVASSAPDTSSAALSGLTGAIGMQSGAQEGMQQGGGQPAEAGGSQLRQGLGNRLYPQDSMVLAGLRRAY